jgi:hypothetical protein
MNSGWPSVKQIARKLPPAVSLACTGAMSETIRTMPNP